MKEGKALLNMNFTQTSPKIAVIGFGYIGSVIGSVLSSRGYDVTGIEKKPYIIDCVKNKKSPFSERGLEERISKSIDEKLLKVVDNISEASGCDVYIITVGTPLKEDNTADVSELRNACETLEPYVKEGSLILIKSTAPPFTTANLVAPIFKNKKAYIAFSPERLAEGNAIAEFESIPIVVGGINEESTSAASKFWQDILGVETICVQNSTAAEMVKLADNLWIDLNIALAHELAFISDKIGVDAIDVIRAANSLPKGFSNVNILTPSVGVGGYCLTKDPWFVYEFGKNYGLDLRTPVVGRNINDSVPSYAADRVDEFFKNSSKSKSEIKIAVLGIAFKNDTGDCRYTPTKGFIDRIIALGYNVEICDPLVKEHDAALVTDRSISSDIDKTMENADCIAFLTGHEPFRRLRIEEIAKKAADNALVFDGRRFFSREEIKEMSLHGLKYRGVGR